MSPEQLLGGRYRLGRHIGRGGMADVYLGTDTKLGRTVAIKILKADLVEDERFRHRFNREAQAAARMTHPAIVRSYDTGEDRVLDSRGNPRQAPYIVMEYVEGKLVKKLIAEHALSIADSVTIALEVLQALEYAHRAGIVHRDIKPGNVMVSLNGQVKVMDFGVARAVADTSTTVADAAGVLGTAQYFSPEQARGELVDARSDLYSTGVMLFEMLTGRPPFIGQTPASVAYQHVNMPAPSPSDYNPEISHGLETVVMTALAKDPAHRYQNAADFIADLERVQAGQEPLGGPYVEIDETVEPDGEETALEFESVDTDAVEQVDTASKRFFSRPWVLVTAAILFLVALTGSLWVATSETFKSANESGVQTVPSVTGMSVDDATKTLQDLGFTVTQSAEANDEYAQGTVTRSVPPSGLSVSTDTPIQIVVSAGKEIATVPSLTGLLESQAEERLNDRGLKLGEVTYVDSATIEKGRVTESSPATGTDVIKDSDVDLKVSTGNIDLPDLRGADYDSTVSTLSNDYPKLQVENEEQLQCQGTDGMILSQSPAAGTMAQNGTVTLRYAKLDASACDDASPSADEEQ